MPSSTRTSVLLFVTLLSACGGEASPKADASTGASPARTSASAVTVGTGPAKAKASASASATATMSASASASVSASVSAASLVGGWSHFYEHNKNNVMEFVPDGTQTPPAMFREHYKLEANGVAEKLCPSPADAHQVFKGTWRLVGDVLEVDVACFGKPNVDRYVVVEVTPTVLKLKLAP
ncbi:MAG: hypothetical protein U0271_05560 [Polyangiaceae bacterium]